MPISVYLITLIELFFVSYFDLKNKKIANFWVIVNLGLAIICYLLFKETYTFSFRIIIYPSLFIFVGFFLFALKIMGAGDSKFLFSLFFLIPLDLQDDYFFSLLYLTIFVGGLFFSFNTVKNFDKIFEGYKRKNVDYIKNVYGKKFPYAPVITLAWVWFGVLILKKIYV